VDLPWYLEAIVDRWKDFRDFERSFAFRGDLLVIGEFEVSAFYLLS
jgi:hypothetical protein